MTGAPPLSLSLGILYLENSNLSNYVKLQGNHTVQTEYELASENTITHHSLCGPTIRKGLLNAHYFYEMMTRYLTWVYSLPQTTTNLYERLCYGRIHFLSVCVWGGGVKI